MDDGDGNAFLPSNPQLPEFNLSVMSRGSDRISTPRRGTPKRLCYYSYTKATNEQTAIVVIHANNLEYYIVLISTVHVMELVRVQRHSVLCFGYTHLTYFRQVRIPSR